MTTKKTQKKNKKRGTPMRMCAACRKRSPKKELVRFVLNNDRMPVLDTDGSFGGRGVNVCPSEECFNNAIERNTFGRAWGESIPREVWDDVRKDFAAYCERKKFRGDTGSVSFRISQEDAEKILDKKVTPA